MTRIPVVLLILTILAPIPSEAAFIRARPLDIDNSQFMLEIVMEEDAMLWDASVFIPSAAMFTIDESVSAFNSNQNTIGFGPAGDQNSFLVRASPFLDVSSGDLVPIAILDYGLGFTQQEIAFAPLYVIRGIPSGSDVVVEIQTPIDRLFPSVPEPRSLVLMVVAASFLARRLRAAG